MMDINLQELTGIRLDLFVIALAALVVVLIIILIVNSVKMSKLKKIKVLSTKITKVGKQAFKKTNVKLKIQVPKKKLKKYRKLFQGKGLGKKANIV